MLVNVGLYLCVRREGVCVCGGVSAQKGNALPAQRPTTVVQHPLHHLQLTFEKLVFTADLQLYSVHIHLRLIAFEPVQCHMTLLS